MFACFAQWHNDRNLINGATDETQFVKLLEEVIELYMSISAGKYKLASHASRDLQDMIQGMLIAGRIKVTNDRSILDDVGDINVVLANMLARRKQSIGDALLEAWNDIKDRKGMMINGVFVKEADLPVGYEEEPPRLGDYDV